MKKGFYALCIVLVAAAVLVSNVLAAPAQSNKNVTLNSVTYEKSGIVLLFHTSGLSQNDLHKISFTALSKQWDITCNFVDDTNVRCLVSKKLSIFAGKGFQGTLAGFHFTGKFPSARAFPSPVVIETSVVAETPTVIVTLDVTETPTGCSDGQTLSYTFEYSNNSSYQTDFTSGYGTTPADNWDALVSAYESSGYTIQNTGSSCN
jgi:hypothetical protein